MFVNIWAWDVVDPLSSCDKTRNRFLLTFIDMSKHYPLAFPTHIANEVSKALISMFTTFGLTEEILSDCGSEFV